MNAIKTLLLNKIKKIIFLYRKNLANKVLIRDIFEILVHSLVF